VYRKPKKTSSAGCKPTNIEIINALNSPPPRVYLFPTPPLYGLLPPFKNFPYPRGETQKIWTPKTLSPI